MSEKEKYQGQVIEQGDWGGEIIPGEEVSEEVKKLIDSLFGSMQAYQEAQGKLKDHVKVRRSYYETMAKSGGFKIDFGEVTAFDHENKTVILGAEQMMKTGVAEDPRLIDFLVQHELGHFSELYSDPEGYEKVVAVAEEENGQEIFGLYNCLMDIYVNRRSADQTPVFAGKGKAIFSDQVRELYREKSFPREQLKTAVEKKEYPLQSQFSAYLLNLGMEVGDDMYELLAEEVKEVIDEGVMVLGKKLTYEEFSQKYLVPVMKTRAKRREKTKWTASISQRKAMIDQYILPKFLALLEEQKKQDQQESSSKDGEEDEEKKPGSQSEGGVEQRTKVWREVLKDAKEKKEEQKKEDEKTEQEKIADQVRGELEKIGTARGIPERKIDDFWERYESLRGEIAQMEKLWGRICHEDVVWQTKREGYYKTGKNLAIDEVIKKWGQIKKQPERVEVMERDVMETQVERRPKEFHLSLLLDISGSMESRMSEVEDFLIVMAASLANFNRESYWRGLERGEVGVKAVLDVAGYNGELMVLMEGKKEIEIGEIMEVYDKLAASGGTNDKVALEWVAERLKAQEVELKEKIKAFEQVEIVLEMTDGETSDPAGSRKVVEELAEIGVAVGGFKIEEGDGSDDDFGKVFGEKGKRIEGVSGVYGAMEELLGEILEEE